MSTRDEILAALTDAPDGMTLKEIAPRCPSAEFDLQIVGGMLATLNHENVIHCSGFREHQLLYFFGKQPVPAHELREAPVTLNSPSVVSEAARAIADMRRRTTPRTPRTPSSTRSKPWQSPP